MSCKGQRFYAKRVLQALVLLFFAPAGLWENHVNHTDIPAFSLHNPLLSGKILRLMSVVPFAQINH